MPKVSIIMPIYNGEKVLKKSIDSILNQEYKDIELICINDGSKDKTLDIINDYVRKDKRVVVVDKENSGVSDSRNMGLDIASGEYIQFVDCDDYITRDSTKIFVREIEKNNADMVISKFYRVVEDILSIKGDIDNNKIMDKQEFADHMSKNPADYYYGVLWNKFFKRSIINKYNLRFDKALNWCEDFIFNLEYIIHIDKIVSILLPTYYYVRNEGSLVVTNLKPQNIVRMKLSVIEYYEDFYKKIYSDEDIKKRKITINKFLFDYSKDEFTFPLLPGTKKVGEEDVKVYKHSDSRGNLFLNYYYMNKLLDRYLFTIAKQFKLDLNEVKLLSYMKYSKNIIDLKEVSDFMGCSQLTLYGIIQILIVKKYIKLSNNENISYELTEQSNAVIKALDDVVDDFYNVCAEGLMDKDREQYLNFYKNTLNNIKRTLGDFS